MAALLTAALALPPALDGESVTGNSSALAIVAVISMAGGYVLLGGLWWFVFRDKARKRRGGDEE